MNPVGFLFEHDRPLRSEKESVVKSIYMGNGETLGDFILTFKAAEANRVLRNGI